MNLCVLCGTGLLARDMTVIVWGDLLAHEACQLATEDAAIGCAREEA